MTAPQYSFEWKVFGDGRAVGFLSSIQLEWVDGKREYELLKEDDRLTLTARFDTWTSYEICKHYFHGFDRTQYGGKYTRCFQFRLNDHRFYGFLCHPEKDARFQICALVLHAMKKQWRVEEKYLRRITDLLQDAGVSKVIDRAFVTEKEH